MWPGRRASSRENPLVRRSSALVGVLNGHDRPYRLNIVTAESVFSRACKDQCFVPEIRPKVWPYGVCNRDVCKGRNRSSRGLDSDGGLLVSEAHAFGIVEATLLSWIDLKHGSPYAVARLAGRIGIALARPVSKTHLVKLEDMCVEPRHGHNRRRRRPLAKSPGTEVGTVGEVSQWLDPAATACDGRSGV